jgi:hypothetical protein
MHSRKLNGEEVFFPQILATNYFFETVKKARFLLEIKWGVPRKVKLYIFKYTKQQNGARDG